MISNNNLKVALDCNHCAMHAGHSTTTLHADSVPIETSQHEIYSELVTFKFQNHNSVKDNQNTVYLNQNSVFAGTLIGPAATDSKAGTARFKLLADRRRRGCLPPDSESPPAGARPALAGAALQQPSSVGTLRADCQTCFHASPRRPRVGTSHVHGRHLKSLRQRLSYGLLP